MSSKSSKDSRNVVKLKRPAHKTWTPLIPFAVAAEAAAEGIVAAFQNNLITVWIKETSSHGFKDDQGKAYKMAHLIVKGSELTYKQKLRLKDELCHPESDMAELFPAKWRRLDPPAWHFWVLPIGTIFPFGLIPSNAEQAIRESAGQSEYITKEEMMLAAVSYESVAEIFSCREEMMAAYGDRPITGIIQDIMMSDAQPESETVVWTEAAKRKCQQLLLKSRRIEMSEAADRSGDEIGTIEDEICPDGVDRPGLEEGLAMASAMRDAACAPANVDPEMSQEEVGGDACVSRKIILTDA